MNKKKRFHLQTTIDKALNKLSPLLNEKKKLVPLPVSRIRNTHKIYKKNHLQTNNITVLNKLSSLLNDGRV